MQGKTQKIKCIVCGKDCIIWGPRLEEMKKKGEIEPFDLLVYGTSREQGETLSVSMKILDYSTGVIIGENTIRESGNYSVPALSLRGARYIYKTIPFSGKVLKAGEESIFVNLGLFDGLASGEKLVINKIDKKSRKYQVVDRLVFTVTEVDTLVSEAAAERKEDIDRLEPGDRVYVMTRRRARKLD